MKSDERIAPLNFAPATPEIDGWPLFAFGRVMITANCLYTLLHHNLSAREAFGRHTSGDWGDLAPEYKARNNKALLSGKAPLCSIYILSKEVRLRIITASSRSHTRILLANAR